ncbi:MAG: NAD(P)-dependent oxidoreductase [Planctomycetota bacterium]|nr:NAD(P)-dependent oxidoreductase [Planctomycetota bacterium]
MRVLIVDKFEKSGLQGIQACGCEAIYEPETGAEKLVDALSAHRPEILVVRSTKVQAKAIEAARVAGVKLIVRAGAGVDNIDVPAATNAGIKVCNCPGMNADAVAELAIGLLISCDRRIPDQTVELRSGAWNKKEYAKARGLRGATLGIVGFGNIGIRVARIAKAMGMKVMVWSKNLSRDECEAAQVIHRGSSRDELDQLLPECDAITLHVAATSETEKLVDAKFLGLMKPGAYLINTSRGSVVDEAALRDAVLSKGIRAGLDVYQNQPSQTQGPFDCAIAKLPGVYCTHHAGASTDQAQLAVADETVRIIGVYKHHARAENAVN